MTSSSNNLYWDNEPVAKSPLHETFVAGIKELYWSENHLVRTLLKLNNGTIDCDLQRMIRGYVETTKKHAYRLEQMFDLLDEQIDSKKCAAMSALCVEADEAIEYTVLGTPARNTSIALITEKISQFEISAYSDLIRIADNMEREDLRFVLSESLKEEQFCLNCVRDLNEMPVHKSDIAA